MRRCVKTKGYPTCAECQQTDTCQHLEQWRKRPDFDQRMQRIKQIGATKYVEEMTNKVETGYCYLDDKK